MQTISEKIKIGTSGFYYEHWKGVFYPQDMARAHFFDYYVKQFSTVELNSTFYHLPKAKTVEHWFQNAPEDFLFALKASREITHYRKLKDVRQQIYLFLHLVKPLKEKLAAILFQLPPSLHKERELLAEFLALLPSGYRFERPAPSSTVQPPYALSWLSTIGHYSLYNRPHRSGHHTRPTISLLQS